MRTIKTRLEKPASKRRLVASSLLYASWMLLLIWFALVS